MVCRRVQGSWQLFVDVPSREAIGEPLKAIVESLREVEGLFGPIADPASLIGAINRGSRRPSPPVAQEELALFRLSGDDVAYEIAAARGGPNIVIAPNNWRYDEQQSGAPPQEPEPLGIAAYTVHYFSAQQNSIVVFRKPDGSSCKIKAAKPRFRLEGDQIWDANERVGPAFIGKPPVLRADPES